MIMEIRTKRNQMGNVGYYVGRGSMSVWFKRVSLGIAILGLVLAAPAAAQNGRGNGNGGSEAAGVAGAGVGEAGKPVVLRPTGPVSGQFIVVFQDDITNPRGLANALARQNGFSLRGVYTTALKGFSARMPDAVAERLSLDPDVAYVEQDAYVHADELVTGVDRIDAETNATAGIGLGGMVDVDVAVIDSGISPHADLNWSNARFYNCIGGCVAANAFDDNGHGSHVAGTIGALDDGVNFNISGTDYEVVGVAPGARLWGFKVLDSAGSGFVSDIIAAVDKVTQLGVIEVANMSLSGQGFVAAFRTAIQNSVGAGVVHVVAAGNAQMDIYGPDGVLNESTSFSCLLLGRNCPDDIFPASYPEAMAVSAMADFDGTAGGLNDQTIAFNICTHEGDDVFACLTNFSQSVDGSNPVVSPGAAIDVAGPGVRILSTWNGEDGVLYKRISGTSMASPHVAGAVALCIVEDCATLFGPPSDAADVAAIRQAIIDGAQLQSQWGPADTKDPDSNAEGLVYVGGDVGLTHDVAVTSVTAPSPVLVGATHTVSVDVTNNGSEPETITVSLSDSLTANISDPQLVTLDSGASTTLGFSWTPTVTGNHTLTGSHDLVDENGANDTASTTVSVSDPVTDAAVTSITAPSPVDVNTLQSVAVDVANNSTQNETITVTLTDSLGATIDAPKDVMLDSGASTTLNFSWTATESGDHVLTATTTLTGDSDPSNDSMQTTSTVTEPGSSVFEVSITYAGEGGRNGTKHLHSEVTVQDNGSPVSGASVNATVDRIDMSTDIIVDSRTETGVTDSNGVVVFSWKNAKSDCYETHVNSVDTEDMTGQTPANSIDWPNLFSEVDAWCDGGTVSE